MEVGWLTAFIDRPADAVEPAVQFWCAVTGSRLSAARGDHDQFATLVPASGDAYLRVQRVGEGQAGRGCHLDLHTDDVGGLSARVTALGARAESPGIAGQPPIFTSPAGLTFCVVAHRGERQRPEALSSADGVRSLVDQVSIDIPAGLYDGECQFWSRLTGWEQRASTIRAEFRFLERPLGSPLRILLQRRDDDTGAARAHLDFACDDVAKAVIEHESLGATVARRFEHWTTLIDPSGYPYCVTGRDPRTGALPGP